MSKSSKNIQKVFKGKRLLFLENGNSLEYGVDTFQELLIENGIEHTVIFDLISQPFEDILQAIHEHDGIVFQTQWVYETSKKLKEYMFALKEKKSVVEVYINEPTWYYKPDVSHDLYIFKKKIFSDDDHEFYKLSKKAYWDYKNNFDK